MELFFNEPRLHLSRIGDFCVRLVSYVTYVTLVSVTFLLFFSDIPRFRWLALLFFLFLSDRFIHIGEGEQTLSELKGERVNVNEVVTPRAYHLLSSSFYTARSLRQPFHLVLLYSLIKKKDIE